jgi:LysM repeat protein
MNQWKRLSVFLLLNIFVSACTTLAILVAWDRLRAPLPGGLIALPAASLARSTSEPLLNPENTPAPATPAAAASPAYETYAVKDGDTFESIAQAFDVSVEDLVAANGYTQAQTLSPNELLRIPVKPLTIDSVIGAGDLNTEKVVLVSNLDSELSLAGWQIDNGQGSSFVFPDLTLNTRGSSVNLYTKAGANTTADLFWGLQVASWQPGMVVTLRDPQGKAQASYTIP